MLRILLVSLLTLLNGCDSAQSEGNGRSSGESHKSKKPDLKDSEDSGQDDDHADAEGKTDKVKPADSDSEQSSSGVCNFKFSDKLADKINAKGQAQAPIVGNISFSLAADATLSITSSAEKASVGLVAKITSFSPSIARSIADKVIDSYKDPLKLTMVPASELAEFYKNNAGWEKLNCIVAPVTKISNNAYEYEFEPALPVIIAPTSSMADMSSAIESSIEIGKIKSKLIRHFQPESIAKRGTYEGSAKIEKNGDIVSISYDFGSKAPEAMATPIAGISFGLSSTKGKYDSVTITSFVADNSKIDLKLSK